MTTLEILKAARAQLPESGKWCRGALARNDRGKSVPVFSGNACSYCALGMASAVAGCHEDADVAACELDATANEMGFACAAGLNDSTDLPTVLAMYDATIARLEKVEV